MASSASVALYRSVATTQATASPAYRTSSTAIGGWSGMTMSSVTGHAHGRLPCSPARSRPLNAATTPGLLRAAEVSTRVTRACAIGLRRNATYSMPGSWMLSVHWVRPVTSRASSLRRRAAPTSCLPGAGSLSMSPSAIRRATNPAASSSVIGRSPLLPGRSCSARPAVRPGRCCSSRYTGRGCPPAPRGSPRRRGRGRPSAGRWPP